MPRERILVGMSGGIDSTVAALLLAEAGFEPVGLTLLLGNNAAVVERAKQTSNRFGIEHHFVDASSAFADKVVDYFFYEYLQGRTPNPCLRCNQTIKWPYLFEMADKLNCSSIATGHYVVNDEWNGTHLLKKATDSNKDQSFFLWHLTPYHLQRIVFPLGTKTKADVLAMAEKYGLKQLTSSVKSSVGLCFLVGDYRLFLKNMAAAKGIDIPQGAFYSLDGKWLGRHRGIPFYSVGQRKGLGLTLNKPLFVNKICAKDGTIFLSDFSSLLKNSITLKDFVLHHPFDLEKVELEIRVRYRGKAVTGRAQLDGDKVQLRLNSPEWSIAPGQAIALYWNDWLVGGGFICETEN